MPGKKITDHQVHKCKQHRNTLTQVAAAARANNASTPQCRAQQAWTRRDLNVFDETSQAYVAGFPAGHVVAAERMLMRVGLLARAGRGAEAATAHQAGVSAWQTALGRTFVSPVLGFH